MTDWNRYEYGLLETAELLHANTTGATDLLQEEVEKRIRFLERRMAEWKPSESQYDSSVYQLLVAVLAELSPGPRYQFVGIVGSRTRMGSVMWIDLFRPTGLPLYVEFRRESTEDYEGATKLALETPITVEVGTPKLTHSGRSVRPVFRWWAN